MNDEQLILHWCAKVRDKNVDPDDECDWFDLAYGFFLGMGLEPEHALNVAEEVHRRNLL